MYSYPRIKHLQNNLILGSVTKDGVLKYQ